MQAPNLRCMGDVSRNRANSSLTQVCWQSEVQEDLKMTVDEQPTPPSTDLFTLKDASIAELLAALREPATLADEGGVVPARSLQVSELIVAESVRLIRLAPRAELAEAADELAQSLIAPDMEGLERRQPEAHLLVVAASIVLGAAVAASSSGGEMTVLRSWAGKALEAVAAVNREEGETMQRSKLRAELGIEDESYLSHLLADLEAAGLLLRVREGREITLHLGPTGYRDHVQDLLPEDAAGVFWQGREEEEELLPQTKFFIPLTKFQPDANEDDPAVGNLAHLHFNDAISRAFETHVKPLDRSDEQDRILTSPAASSYEASE
jgi:hypothetical protein